MRHHKLFCYIMSLLFATFIISPLQFGTSNSGIVAKAACELTTEQIVNYFNSRVGETYASNACLAFVADGFQALGAERSSACCAYNYGLSHLSSTSRDIPIGADVFFTSEGCKYDYIDGNGHHSGHIGVYVGDGYIVHSYSSKIQKMLISTVESHGYTYWGWGYHGGISIGEPDIYPPLIQSFSTEDVTSEGFTLVTKITDNVGVDKVSFTVWKDGSPYRKTVEANYSHDDFYCYRFAIKDFTNETGVYHAIVEAFDKRNCSSQELDIIVPEKKEEIMGDCNNDGSLSVADVILLQKWILQIPNAALKESNAADLNGDGVVDVFDLGLLKRAIIAKN